MAAEMIELRSTGIELLGMALTGLAGAVGIDGMSPVLEDLGIVVEAAIARSFETERAPEMVGDVTPEASAAAGAAWEPLAETTKQRRRGDGDAAQILRDTGLLSQSIGREIGRGEVTVGTGRRYGLYHQSSTEDMPARPFVGIDESDVDVMLRVTVEHIEAALAR
jgi:phage gpG-like protein